MLIKVSEKNNLEIYGEIDHDIFFEENTYYQWRDSTIRRSIFMGDYIYAIGTGGITVSKLDDLTLIDSFDFDKCLDSSALSLGLQYFYLCDDDDNDGIADADDPCPRSFINDCESRKGDPSPRQPHPTKPTPPPSPPTSPPPVSPPVLFSTAIDKFDIGQFSFSKSDQVDHRKQTTEMIKAVIIDEVEIEETEKTGGSMPSKFISQETVSESEEKVLSQAVQSQNYVTEAVSQYTPFSIEFFIFLLPWFFVVLYSKETKHCAQ
jgi:hypothetical protein